MARRPWRGKYSQAPGIGCQTMPVTDAEAYRFVADHDGRRAADVGALGAGDWSRAYAFVLDGRAAVIRLGDHVEWQRERDQRLLCLNRGAAWRPLPAGVPCCCPRSASSQASTQSDTETSQPRAGRPLL